jgi:hypothetical protein
MLKPLRKSPGPACPANLEPTADPFRLPSGSAPQQPPFLLISRGATGVEAGEAAAASGNPFECLSRWHALQIKNRHVISLLIPDQNDPTYLRAKD